ncbi:uncharacterized protein HGUI_02193 [Hanseniaspora guilliermondii]|uniref:Extracellular mutant protein 11 C-terminal domain-containing protein n=1 Tax=Hanseniaspora guilliermondii TaxID=56406 RepID=A0A1L0CNF9_9ASCO|nr:uncharacterized protein HGUI_02193 [Hanseniaspora guilliermondii]
MSDKQNKQIPDVLSMDIKKMDKAEFQPVKHLIKSKQDTSPYKHRNPNKKQKYSPSNNIDPSQITSILKGSKTESNDSQGKKYKVTFDENLNLEHTLTSSELSLTNNEILKKPCVQTSPKKRENKLGSPNKISTLSPNKIEKKTSPKKSPTKTRSVDSEVAILTKHKYTPIQELSLSRKDCEENARFCGLNINMNSEEFHKKVFSQSQDKQQISQYSGLSIDEWLKKGNELLEQKSKITKQIMAARIRSSYAHKIITDHINARAEALEAWQNNVHEQDKKFTSQMKMFLNDD